MSRAAYGLEARDASVADRSGGRFAVGQSFPATTPHEIPVDWTPQPPGATTVDVSDAAMLIAPRAADASVPAVTVAPGAAGTFVLTLPQGLRVSSLSLKDLAIGAGEDRVSLASQGDLTSHDPPLRLTVALPDPRGGFASPSYAVPAVGGRAGVTPDSLTGARFDGGVLTLPEVAASKLRIALVTGDPGEFKSAAGVSLSDVAAGAARYPTGLALSDGAGGSLWSFPKELAPNSAAQTVDFKVGLKKALSDRIKAGAAPSLSLSLTASSPAAVHVSAFRIRGALVRAFPGTVRTLVEGSATPLNLPKAAEPALTIDDTTTITGDVTVRYEGIRVLRELSDDVPTGASAGGIVAAGAEAPRVTLPPEALKGRRLARIGIVGRAPEDCELSVRLVKPLTGQPLPGDPAVVRPATAATMGVVWAVLPTPSDLGEPVAIAVRVTRGRFLWATRDDGRPSVQVAIEDPNPPERTVRLGAHVVVADLTPAHRAAINLTPCFAAGMPRFTSPLFVTVNLSDVTVRYAR